MEQHDITRYQGEDKYELNEKQLSAIDSTYVETEAQTNWDTTGRCLQYILHPVLRRRVVPFVSELYDKLEQNRGISNQTHQKFLRKYPENDGYELCYENINNNQRRHKNKKKFDYKVKNEVDFSKLFLSPQLASYQTFDETCLSVILTLIINIREFPGPLRVDATKIRKNIRNKWAHFDQDTWDDKQTNKCFRRIQQCIKSLNLEEEEESQTLHEVLKLRYEEKSKNIVLTAIRDRVAENHLALRSSGTVSFRCSTCKNAKRLQQIQTTNDDRLSVDQLSPEDLTENWVCLVKLYPWLKEEMTKHQALCIASQMLKPDHVEVLHQATSRRMVVDGLLKRCLHCKTQIHKFLYLLRYHMDEVVVLEKQQLVKPTKEEIKACDLRNKPSTHPENHDAQRWHMLETDKPFLLDKIKDIVTIDTLNNSLFSGFYFSLVDHDKVCDCIKRSDFAQAASCLVETMGKYPRSSIMNCFCNTLESLEDTADVVELLGLRDKYCKPESIETARGQVFESGLLPLVLRNLERIRNAVRRILCFTVAEPRLGSILIRLGPLEAISWDNLKRNCLSGNIINVFRDIFLDDKVITWMETKDRGLLVTIYAEECGLDKGAADPDAILKLELISKDRSFPKAPVAFDSDNPIERNIKLLCEELEICDELLSIMQTEELVPRDMSDKLKQTNSRASKIRFLLKSISQPEEGYRLLKEYLRYTNSYLFQELELRDNSKLRRKLVFQCEAQLKRSSAESHAHEQTHYIFVPRNSTTTSRHEELLITKQKCFFEQSGGPVKGDDVRKDNQTEQELSLYDASTSMVKATTRNRTSEDIDDTKTKSGVYKIALEKEIQAEVPARMATIDERLKDEEYRHWMKAVLCLQYTKDGLVSFASRKSQDLHNAVLAQIRRSGNPSANGLCSTACIDFKKRTIKCCTNCNAVLVETKKYCTGTLNLTNFDIKDLQKQPWQLAKLFMNPGQDDTNTIPELTDLCGILNFVDYCTLAKMAILNPANINAVRDTRNRILHNPDMKITKDDFSKNITPALISLLQDPLYLLNDTAAQDAVIKIKQVESSSFHIGKNDEIQALKNMFADLVTSKCGINAKLLELKTKVKDSEETTGQEISKVHRNLSTELEEQKTEIQKVQISFECLKNKIKDDNELQNLMRDQVTEMLEVPFKDIKDQVQSQQQELERLKNRLASVEKKTTELQQEQRDLKRHLDTEEKRMDDMQCFVQNLQEPLPTVSLEDELKLQQYLRDGYKERLTVPTLQHFHTIPINKIFAPVVILKENKSSLKASGALKQNKQDPKRHGKGEEQDQKIGSSKISFNTNALQKRNFLLGKAGVGKTTFCKHLTDIWCNASQSPYYDDAGWLQFRSVFHKEFRHASESESVFDMICNHLIDRDSLKIVAKHVLNTKPDTCLVIGDGLDEWKDSATQSAKTLYDIPGLPSTIDLHKCVMLTTSRPWRVHALSQRVEKAGRVFELLGIDDVKTLTKNVFTELQEADPEQASTAFLQSVKASNMGQLIQIPLLLINALTTWHMHKSLNPSICVNYSYMVEAFIQCAKGESRRSGDKNRLTDATVRGLSRLETNWADSARLLPDCFRTTNSCKEYAGLIINLGHLAFDLLVREKHEQSLVFSKQETMCYLNEKELEVCLTIGILSQSQVRGRGVQKIDKLCFCHRTFQEFLGSLWLSIMYSNDCYKLHKAQ